MSAPAQPYRFGVVDIGSNTVKVTVYACHNGRLASLYSDADTVRIGHRVGETGRISDERLERLLEALRRYEARAIELDASRFLAVATQAFRIAGNVRETVERIERETRWRVEIIDAEEETRLTFEGARPWMEPGVASVVADIGGASTEIISVRPDGGPERSGSVPIGSGLLYDEEIGDSPPPRGSLDRARERAASIIAASGVVPASAHTLLLPGGTGHYLNLLAGSLAPGATLAPEHLALLRAWLGSRHAIETMERIPVQIDRAQVLPASFAIVEALDLRCHPKRILAIPSGIRDGVARTVCQPSRTDHR
jgi:exopolyphosphatase / guanosine-5'-triphosphate,3'-diphosphate pyrophosphatase